MTAPLPKSDVYTDFQGLSALRARAREDREASLREVAGQFEALFIQMMLKSMRDATLGGGLLDNDQTATYQSMFDRQIAIDMSRGRGIGLADMMVRQLSRPGAGSTAAETDSGTPKAADAATGYKLPSRVTEGKATASHAWAPASPEAFLRELWPHAQRAADELGARPEALLAQAALETGWGKHMIRGSDGRNSFNLFGIKADARWQGERVSTETVEFRDGVMRRERAQFRAYQSLADSFNDYADFLKSNPRYQEALEQAGDATAWSRALAEAGYATDPEYSNKINNIMNGDTLREAVSGIKKSEFEPLG